MAIYYVDAVSGSNSNTGLSPAAAVATINYAVSLCVAYDKVLIKAAQTHTLTADITSNLNPLTYDVYDWDYTQANRPIIAGSFYFSFAASGQKHYFFNLIFQNRRVVNSMAKTLFIGNATLITYCENCDFVAMQNTTSFVGGSSTGTFIFERCNVLNPSGYTNVYFGAGNTTTSTIVTPMVSRNCYFYNLQAILMNGQNNVFSFKGAIVDSCTYFIEKTFTGFTDPTIQLEWSTIYNMTAFIRYNVSGATVSCISTNIYRCYINCANMVSSLSTITLNGGNSNNALYATGTTGYTSTNDTTLASLAAAEFYDTTNHDFRIEITSPLASYNGDTIGAKVPDWDSFWSDLPATDVKTGVNYRVRSRVNNRTGSLSSAGETDPTKVLTTSTIITGQYVAPTTANVKTGVSFGVSQTGTYDGSDRWTDPGIANVRSGTAYKANSTSNNRTGTAAIPTAANVRSGVSTDATTGTLDLPATTDVKIGVTFDGASKTGSYDGSDRWSDPGIANVLLGVAYKANSTTNNRTGTSESTNPGIANVLAGTTYKINSVSYTGTYVILVTDNILASELKIGVTKLVNNSSVTGTYDGSDRWTDPGELNVRIATAYKANSLTNNKTGTLDVYAEADLPSENDVRKDTVYGDNQTGLLDVFDEANLPIEADVRKDTIFGDNQTGTLDVFAEANLPDVSDVRKDTIFGDNETGTLDVMAEANLPSESQVLDGVTFGDSQVGNVVLPETDEVKEGVQFGPNDSLEGSVVELDLTKFTDVPEDKVLLNYPYKYNSDTDNRLGTAEGGSNSTDPGEWNVLKDTPYVINGVPLVGKYDNGELQQPSGDNIRIKILKEIENTLYGIDQSKKPIYQNTVKLVSFESGIKQGVVQDDLPYVQIIADENVYDHQFVLSGNRPKVTMTVKFAVTTPSNWNTLDNESLYEDIRQAFIRDNFSLNGLVIDTRMVGVKPVNADSDKLDDNRKAEITIRFCFIEQITNLN